MRRFLILASFALVSLPNVAHAVCPSFHSLTNGTTADATKVMDNFNYVLECPNFTGNVGVGTAAPDSKLTILHGNLHFSNLNLSSASQILFDRGGAASVSGGQASAGMVYNGGLSGGNEALVFNVSAGNDYRFKEGGDDLLSISDAGTLRIGSANTSNQSNLIFSRGAASTITGQQASIGMIYNGGLSGSNEALTFNVTSGNDYRFKVNGTDLMSIKDSGNIGVGTTSPSYKLHVNGSVAGTSAYNNLSDVRLKKDVGPIVNAMAIVERLRGVRFRWRAGSERTVGADFDLPIEKPQLGFLAQELQTALPEAVIVAPGDDAIMSVEETKVIPVLVEAIKQQQADIRRLQREVRQLNGVSDDVHDTSLLQRMASLIGW